MMTRKYLGTALLSLLFLSPAHALNDLNGKATSLSQYTQKGLWTIVKIWRSDCVPCKNTMPDLVSAAHTMRNTQVLGISLDDDRAAIRQSMQRYGVNFPNLQASITEMDQYLQRVAEEPLSGTPTWLIFSPWGELKAMQKGTVRLSEIRSWLNKQRKQQSRHRSKH